MRNYIMGTGPCRYILALGAAIGITAAAQEIQDDPLVNIGKYMVKESHIPKLKIAKGINDGSIWVGKSDKSPYILNFFTDTAKMTLNSLAPTISEADANPADNVLTDDELGKYFDEIIRKGLDY